MEKPKKFDPRSHLLSSDWVFSGMKTFHELNEAFPSLLDENGNKKPFVRFLNDVQKIDKTYNSNYLRAEYNFVTASAEMAAKWEEFEQDGDRYYLQYRTQKDGRVRPEHALLDGVTLPPSDPFWQEFYPPNGWNCRCNVIQVRKSKYPASDPAEARIRGEEAVRKDKKRMFRFNPGKERKTVPDYNPYTISHCRDCDIAKGKLSLARTTPPASQLCAACRFLKNCDSGERERIEANRKEYERLKNDPNYTDVEFNPANGGLKATHIHHNFDDRGGKYEKNIQKAGFREGHTVIFEAEIMSQYKVRSTEGLWDGKYFEVSGRETATKNNILRGLKHCAAKIKTQIAVLDFPNGGFDEDIFLQAYKKYLGLEKLNDSQFLKFEKIICVQNEHIVLEFNL